MIPTILEIFACLIAVISGFIGIVFGMNSYTEYSIYIILISGLLVFNVFCYLMNTSELLQTGIKDNAMKVLICRVLYKSIYGIFALQIIAITLMVK